MIQVLLFRQMILIKKPVVLAEAEACQNFTTNNCLVLEAKTIIHCSAVKDQNREKLKLVCLTMKYELAFDGAGYRNYNYQL